MSDAAAMCPACAGQLQGGETACPWCGTNLGPDAEATHAGPPGRAPVSRPDVGFGSGSDRPLPPMPPPPRALPFENLSSGQVMLRAIVVLLVLFVIVLFGRRALHDAVCDPRNPAPLLCPDYAQAAPDEQP